MNFPKINREFWQRLLRLIYPYFFQSSEKLSAWILIAIGNGLLFLASFLGPTIIRELGDMLSALAKGDQPRFYHAVSNFALRSLMSSISVGIGYYSLNLLLVRWRFWLSKEMVGGYLGSRAYYRISNQQEIDNPDQRITEGIETFLAGVLGLNTLIPIFSGRSLSATTYLWGFSHNLTIILILVGSLATWFGYQVFFRTLYKIKYAQSQREGDFRTGLVKIRENSESIAFYRGEDKERGYLNNLFQAVFVNKNLLLLWQNIYFGSFSGANDIIVAFLGYAFAAPQILAGKVEIGTLTTVLFNSSVLYLLFSIFGQIIDNLSDTFNALVRLEQLKKAIDVPLELPNEEIISIEDDSAIKIRDLTLKTPIGGLTLFEKLNFTLKRGENLLIMGKSGSGKSSLIKAIAGLWLSGTGVISRPYLNNIFFLPQKPYLGLGNLRQQLVYSNPDSHKITQEQLERVLKIVNLKDLPERIGGFEEEIDWAKFLSPGEQQRLSFARVLLSAAQFIILDEATSALDLENEKLLYDALIEQKETIISIGHRSSLIALHDRVLKLPPEE